MNKYPLSSVAEVIRGVTFSKSEGTTTPSDDKLPVIRAGSIQQSLLLDKGQIWIPANKIKSNQLIKKNDIIMCTSSGSSELVGKCAKSTQDWNGSFGAFCAGIRVNKSNCSSSYLYHFLCSPHFRNWTKSSSGANIKNIRASELAAFEIPLPSLEEQKRIAVILDKADVIRRKRQEAIELTDQFLRSVFLDMFGDPVRNPKRWELIPLANISEKVTVGHVGSVSKHYCEDGILMLRTGNIDGRTILNDNVLKITPKFHQKLKKSQVRSKDVLITRHVIGEIGCAVVPDNYPEANCLNIILIRPGKKLNSQFLSALLRTKSTQDHILQRKVGTAQAVVNTGVMKEWNAPIPPLELQNKFEKIVNNILAVENKYKNSLFNINELFNALTQKAFRGELRNSTNAA